MDSRRLIVSRLIVCLMSLAMMSCASVDKGMMKVASRISVEDPVTGAREASFESEEDEVARAEHTVEALLAAAKSEGSRLDNEIDEFGRVKGIFERLIAVAHRRDLPWEVHLIESETWNAFTVGGGKVFLFTGVLGGELALQGDDELAAVIAHEIAHNTARHSSERRGKLTLSKLGTKKAQTDAFRAAFKTVHEDEADKYSSIYMALAGYDPEAAVRIWERMDKARGSYSAELLHTHPLNGERAENMRGYVEVARQYYAVNTLNPDYETLVACNELYCRKGGTKLKAGEGGGSVALASTALNTALDVLNTKMEQRHREREQIKQQNAAMRQLRFGKLRIAPASTGGRGIFGVAQNASASAITAAKVKVQYLSGSRVVYEDLKDWPGMAGRELRQFGLSLKPINYTSVRLLPVYVQLEEED